MDHNHKLDAPNNDTLKDVEQITDRSELSTLYFRSHNEWDGKEIISHEQRQAKYTQEQIEISRSIRRSFVWVGLLIPTPFILLAVVLYLAVQYLSWENIQFTLPLALAMIAAWGAAVWGSLKLAHAIFYNHALQTTPFYIIISALLIPVAVASYLFLQPFFGTSTLLNILIVCASVYLASIVISGIILTIWTSPRIPGRGKISSLVGMALLLVAVAVAGSLV